MLRLSAVVISLALFGGVFGQTCKGDKEDCATVTGTKSPFNQDTDWSSATSMYDFHAKDIHGNDVSLDKYRGHVAIVVNVASQCGLTDSNYRQLVELYKKYGESQGLRILAFPSNQFGGQEPGSAQQILDFVKGYNVTFDVFDKVDVNGDNAHPFWKWLKIQASGFMTNDIIWNFAKFVVDKNGKVVYRVAPTTGPLSLESTLQQYF